MRYQEDSCSLAAAAATALAAASAAACCEANSRIRNVSVGLELVLDLPTAFIGRAMTEN